MELTKVRNGDDPSTIVNGPPLRRIFVQTEMGSVGVIVFRISVKQLPFARHNHMVQQIPPAIMVQNDEP